MDPRKNEAKTPSRSHPRASQSCCQCNTSLGYRLINDDHYSTVKKCLPPCRSAYFSDEQSVSMMNMWLTLLSLLCALSCAFVLLTFFLDTTRFRYPQRPIIFLSLCYFFVSSGYLIRLMVGHENVACRLDRKVKMHFLQIDLALPGKNDGLCMLLSFSLRRPSRSPMFNWYVSLVRRVVPLFSCSHISSEWLRLFGGWSWLWLGFWLLDSNGHPKRLHTILSIIIYSLGYFHLYKQWPSSC